MGLVDKQDKEMAFVYDIDAGQYDYIPVEKTPNNNKEKIQYVIRNRGLKNFEMPIKYEADNMVYFDVETAPWSVNFHNKREDEEDGEIYLKMDTLQLTCFSFFIGKNIKYNEFDLRTLVEREFENEEKYILQRPQGIAIYSSNASKNLEAMLKILGYLQRCKGGKKLQLCGHNALKFDSYLFLHVDPKYKPRTDTHKEQKEKILEWKMDGRNYKVIVCDTLSMAKAFGCGTVEKMGKVVGMNKLSYSAHENRENYTEYCLRDSEIVYLFMLNEINHHGIFDLNPARYSRNYFYNRFFSEHKNIEVIGTSANVNKFEVRAARTEAYFKEIKDSYYVDANSLYPTAQTRLDMVVPTEYPSMIKDEHTGKMVAKLNDKGEPIRRLHYGMCVQNPRVHDMMRLKLEEIFEQIREMRGFTPQKLKEIYDYHFSNKFYMLEVKLLGIREDFGTEAQKKRLEFYFPFVLKKMGKTIFRLEPDHTYQIGFYEILFLSFFDYEIKDIWAIDKGKGIFTPYVEELYAQRRKKKEAKQPDKFEKLVLNSGGYGIFIIKNRESKKIEDSKVHEFFNLNPQGQEWKLNINKFHQKKIDLETLNITTPRYFRASGKIFEPKFIGDNVYSIEESEMKWIESSIPILGLNILSNSRFFMYCFYLNSVFDGSYQIYYTDTDSLFCNKRLYEFIQNSGYDGKELGQFKLEYFVDRAFFLAPKAYVTLHHENGEYIVTMTLKGTGEAFVRNIIINRPFQKTLSYKKVAFNPTTIQKRVLDSSGKVYLNKFSDGDEEKWKKQYQEYMEKAIEFYKFAIEENKKNGFDTEAYESTVEDLSKEMVEVLEKTA